MIESRCITTLKHLTGEKDSQSFLSSQCPPSKKCRLRRLSTVRCGARSYWIYLLFWLVWTMDIRLLRFGFLENSRLHPNESGSIYVTLFGSRAPYCFASEVSEDSDRKQSNRKVKKAAVTMKPASSVVLPTTNTPASPVDSKFSKPPMEKLSLNQILYRAGKRGLGGGIPGAIAGAIQVLSLMWLRTIINYQCRYGTTFLQALRTLLNDGGVSRLYCGVGFALIQAPLARFVSTAANDGVESLLANLSFTKDWGPGQTTVVASIVVGLWRMLLMPIDTAKTVLQIDSVEGFRSLARRVKAGRLGLLYSGAIANAISAILGHYPWFYTYNVLSSSIFVQVLIPSPLFRNAAIGIASSVVSDSVVNVFRVIKTTKQSLGSKQNASYLETVRVILAADGYKGLFGRGLRTRIYANALQSVVFTVIWRGLADHWRKRKEAAEGELTKHK